MMHIIGVYIDKNGQNFVAKFVRKSGHAAKNLAKNGKLVGKMVADLTKIWPKMGLWPKKVGNWPFFKKYLATKMGEKWSKIGQKWVKMA